MSAGCIFLALVVGYLLGSFSTAYWVSRWVAGIDIRDRGDGNAGTVNTFKVVGPLPGVLVAVVDLSKGVLALWLTRAAGCGVWAGYLAGFAAIAGHVFPFYLRFRGGQGAATATGLLLYSLAVLILRGWFPWQDLLFLAWIVIVFALVSRKGEILGVLVLPTFTVLLLLHAPREPEVVATAVLLLFLLSVVLRNLLLRGVLTLRPEVRETIKWWRFGLRPAALAFPAVQQWLGQRAGVGLVSGVTLAALAGDVWRLSRKGWDQETLGRLAAIFKEKELGRFSSISMFLLSCAVVLIVFPLPIAWLALGYLIFGDMFAKFFGLQYGRTAFFRKTLEGTLAGFAGNTIVAYLVAPAVGLPFGAALAGALAASLAEALPLGVDDNLSMAIVAAATMQGLVSL
ncbi:MAG: hypothetical protein GXO73_08870 [Calditrichaeota bacterium]|nr:hypothetical protein [Calditrichota bacterium]